MFFSGSSGARHELFLSGSSSFLFFCAPSRFLIAAAAAHIGRDQASHQHRCGLHHEAHPARAACTGTKPAAQLVQRRDIIGIMRDTGYNRARERAPRGRGRGRADRSPRRLVYLPRVRGAEEGVLGDSPQRRVSNLIVFTSTLHIAEAAAQNGGRHVRAEPIRTIMASIPSVSLCQKDDRR